MAVVLLLCWMNGNQCAVYLFIRASVIRKRTVTSQYKAIKGRCNPDMLQIVNSKKVLPIFTKNKL